MVTVRRASAAEQADVAAVLASAFGEDPVCCWMCGQEDGEKRMLPFWRSLSKTALAQSDHEVFMSDDRSGVAVWRGVNKWKLSNSEVVKAIPAMARSLRGRLPLALQLLSAMEKAHPTDEHYYLEFLGTTRGRQGKGIGTAVMQPMLERCDIEGVPAYLESSNPRNVPFYARHGFVETGRIKAPKGGPELTAMWREPRGA